MGLCSVVLGPARFGKAAVARRHVFVVASDGMFVELRFHDEHKIPCKFAALNIVRAEAPIFS